jgi:hypothetical protein
MINLFGQKSPRDPDAVLRIKQWAIDLLGLGNDVAVTVMQLTAPRRVVQMSKLLWVFLNQVARANSKFLNHLQRF